MSGKDRYPIFPTRGNETLMRLKLKTAQKGFSIMKTKSDVLQIKNRQLLKQIFLTKIRMIDLLREAMMQLAEARYTGGSFAPHVLSNVGDNAQIKVLTRIDNVAGVQIPVFQILDNGNDINNLTCLGRGGQKVNEAKLMFQAVLEFLVDLASSQCSFIRVDSALKMASMRSNALQYVVIPRISKTQHYIANELEELEREEFFRLKKVQNNKRRETKERETARAEARQTNITQELAKDQERKDREENDRQERERIEREREEREKNEREKERERNEREKNEREKHERERNEHEKNERERNERDRNERERNERERNERERNERERDERERNERERDERERNERERDERERNERERDERERNERERNERDGKGREPGQKIDYKVSVSSCRRCLGHADDEDEREKRERKQDDIDQYDREAHDREENDRKERESRKYEIKEDGGEENDRNERESRKYQIKENDGEESDRKGQEGKEHDEGYYYYRLTPPTISLTKEFLEDTDEGKEGNKEDAKLEDEVPILDALKKDDDILF